MKNKEQRLVENMKMISVELTNKQVSQFIKFYEMLVEWNKVMNLTGITEYDEVVMKHFVDSLSIVKVNGFDNVTSIIDVGTGAGFPGIPLKIVFPEIKITLLDSLNKRIKFLNAVIDELELENIETIHGRAEDFSKKEDYREQYDLCVSRAVANLATLSEYCLPYVKTGGTFISYKSGTVQEEAEEAEKAINILGGQVKDITYFKLPDSEIDRSLVIINKKKSTPGKYPRKAGTPLKEPLS